MDHQVAESSASLSVDVKTTALPTEPEPQIDVSSFPDDLNKSKKKKKKKKNRRKSLEKNEVEKVKEEVKTKKEGDENDEKDDFQEEGEVVDESTVPMEARITESVATERVNLEEEAKNDEVGRVSLEPTSSLDTLKSSGTRAVGSLLSRFKLGRKKSLSSGTESEKLKVELVNMSPAETAGKVPEVMTLDKLSTRTKSGSVGEGEKSAQGNAEKDNVDVEEEQETHEKNARQTLLSTAQSSDEVQTQVEAKAEEGEVVDSSHLSLTDTANSDGQDQAAEFEVVVSSESVTENMAEVNETTVPGGMDEDESTVTAIETLKHETSITLETNGSTDKQVFTTEVQDVLISAEEMNDESTGKQQHSAEVVMIAPVPLKLNLDLVTDQSTDAAQNQAGVEVIQNVNLESSEAAVETFVTETVEALASTNNNDQSVVDAVKPWVADMVDTAAPSGNAQTETAVTDRPVANPSVTESVKIVESNEYSQSKSTSTEKTEMLDVKVIPSTPEVPGASAKLEKMSPVKSLASRFEGKREQSLDSLKFRTVREFFSEERSIRVGAEKKKYEAQAQQQKLKAKAEDEAKAKYKAGSGFKSSEKEAVLGELSPELKNSASIVQAPVVTSANHADSGVLSTPDTAASRKKFSFDEGYTAADSLSKFNDDAQESLTPVKSIASRFEGKHEQSLDNLKFRTVREFFPDEGKRSIHVSAEKAKFEALRKQKEEATMTTEHVKPKVAAHLPSPTTVKREISVEASSVDASIETSLPTLDEACNEMTISAARSSSKTKNGAVVESADDYIEAVAVVSLSGDNETRASAENSSKASSTGSNTASIAVMKEDNHSTLGIHSQAKEMAAKPVLANNGNFEVTVKVDEKIKLDQEAGKAVSVFNTRLVDRDSEEVNRSADVDTTEVFCAHKYASLISEENVKGEEIHDIELKIDGELDKLSLGDAIVHKSAEFDGDVTKEGDIGEQVNVLQALSSQNTIQVTEEIPANSELVELDLGKPVEGVQVDSSVLTTSKVTVTGEESENAGISKEASTEPHGQVLGSASSAENELMELILGGSGVEALKEQLYDETKTNSGPLLTTERLFVMENDHTIETVETVVVGERPMTDGEDDIELCSPTKVRPAQKLFSGITSSKSTKTSIQKTPANADPTLTRKISAVSVGSVQSALAKPTVPISAKRATVPAKKALGATKLQKAPPQNKKKGSAPELKGKVSNTRSTKPPPAAPTVSVSMKRASIIERNTSSWERNVSDHAVEASHSRPALTTPEGAVGPTSFVRPSPPTVPVGSIGAPTTFFKAKKAAEQDIDVAAPSVPARNKKYTNVKSKVTAGIQSGLMQAVTHKTITKEEFIAAERRKSLGSAGVRSVLGAVDRRASLAARATIGGPPEPFVRSALSRKKLNSTLPRYMNYENTPGYAERARQQYERRKRLEEENAAKSEKRQHELRIFFADKQHTTDEVRYEFAKLPRESDIADRKALRAAGPTRRYRRAPSATSSAGTSSSNGVPSRTSKKSSVSSPAEKVVIVQWKRL